MCIWVFIGVYPAAHAQTGSPPSARRPLPDTRESGHSRADPELREEHRLRGTAGAWLHPGRTGVRERDATAGLESSSGIGLFHRPCVKRHLLLERCHIRSYSTRFKMQDLILDMKKRACKRLNVIFIARGYSCHLTGRERGAEETRFYS